MRHGNGVFGIRIHQIKDQDQKTDAAGRNPLDDFQLSNGTTLSSICKTYDWINDDGRTNLGKWAEEAAEIQEIATVRMTRSVAKILKNQLMLMPHQPDLLQKHLGPIMMLNETDYAWLREHYPALVSEGGIISGEIWFRASYNARINTFQPLADNSPVDSEAVTLSGAFQVSFQQRGAGGASRLPALHVQGIEPILDRHFNVSDKSACLCSLLEEDEFLKPDLQFRLFLERLVIPFLYGQVFYSVEKHWPWKEYAHGGSGLLESYFAIKEETRAEECLRQLINNDVYWPRVQAALQRDAEAMGDTLCFCGKDDPVKNCHPRALEGALLLKKDLIKSRHKASHNF